MHIVFLFEESVETQREWSDSYALDTYVLVFTIDKL